MKDPYIFEFLGLSNDERQSEYTIESAIINHIQKFLLEFGKGFAFVARQQHIVTDTSDFYIDLVFYNYILKCFIIVDLKTGNLTHQDIGQIDMYVRMYDDLKRNVESILSENGISLSEAINVYLKQIEKNQGIPFKIQNKTKDYPLTNLAIALNKTGGSNIDAYTKKILNLYEKGLIDYDIAQQALSIK
jgi:addiction module RelB/DinJ family antitoxin